MIGEIEVRQIDPPSWKKMAEDAHLAVFNENWDRELERIDFAMIMVLKEKDEIISYATAQNVDANTVYLQYGGAFEKYRGTPVTFLSFQEMLKYLKKKYSKIVTLVENSNYPMLRFYMKEFFLITGIRYFGSHTFLENSYESFD